MLHSLARPIELPSGMPRSEWDDLTARFLAVSLKGANLGTWSWQPRSGILFFDERWAMMLGYSVRDFPARLETWKQLVHPDDRERSQRLITEHLQGRRDTYENEHRLKHSEGHWVWVLAYGCVVERDRLGAPTLVIGVHLDITGRKHSELKLRQTKEELEGILEAAELGTWQRDYRTGRTVRNARWSAMLGYAPGEIADTPDAWISLLHPDDQVAAVAAVNANLADSPGGYRVEYRLRCRDGRYLWVMDWGRVTESNASGEPTLASGVMLDITAERESKRLLEESRQALAQSEMRARHLALHDALTGLPNRLLFADRLTQAIRRLGVQPASMAVFCLDLDRFKEVNDTFGHQAGDELLQDVARRLQSACGAEHTLARMGGDEFAIVAFDVDAVGAAILADNIVHALSGPADLAVGRVFLSCSVGVSFVTDSSKDPGEVLREADLALYRAKELGRGRHRFFESGMDAAIRLRKALEADLRKALDEEDGTLTLLYQPQVDIRGAIVCVEALLRWNHPERGLILPTVFIPLAENCGLIDRLGQFALRRALCDCAAWRDLRVAINVSFVQLRTPGFAEAVMNAIRDNGADTQKLEIEITESALLEENGPAQRTVRSLHDLGFSLALDDFGSGYSSLSYLTSHPINKIKIDRSFTAQLGQRREVMSVIRAIVHIAEALRLDVVAEGVETEEQHRLLLAAGVTGFQGYLFGRAVDAGTITRLRAVSGG